VRGTQTAYRAVSKAELDDIAAYGLRNKAGAYETGKLFAPTAKEAAQFGKNNFMFDGLPNTIIKVRVPNSVMKSAYRFGADGMNAISIPAEYLQLLRATPLKYTPLP
jgi:ribosomal protein L18